MRRLAVVLAVAGLAACGGSGGAPPEAPTVALAPTFPPAAPIATTAATETTAAAVDPAAPPSTGAAPSAQTSVPAVTAPGHSTASVVDPRGDVTPGATSTPPWADLAGAGLTLLADGFELRVALGGGSAPTSSSPGTTMNVASFYDLDGDGAIDVEVWANVAEGGWGGSWFDNRIGAARYGDDSDVAVAVEGSDVVVRFPASHLDGATSFRWSVASEHGPYGAIGTELAARDDVPDGDAPAFFPG